ncbi:MAG: PaaI family thioesterase [Hyphomicrobiales bacterium]|nr:PaaI family thioesterase [Hyphomicrobiales bacterium]
MTEFGQAEAERLLETAFAPWIKALRLTIVRLDADGAVLVLPNSAQITREGGIICGQALMAAADTAMVFAVAAAAGGYRPMTTVDQTSHFLKPAVGSDIRVDAAIVRIGRTMAYGRVTLTRAADGDMVAIVQTAYALLPEGLPA